MMQINLKFLRWEIFTALLLKVLLLTLIWKLCFSHPLSHAVNAPLTIHHMLSTKGDNHGS